MNINRRRAARWLAVMAVLLALTPLAVRSSFTPEPPPQYGLGDIPLDPQTYQRYLRVFSEDAAESLPTSYDARSEGIVTSAKNQGSCGSCWAFASVGAMESHMLKAYGVGPEDLSEQQQVSCNASMAGCSGGSASSLRYWENKGPLYESCFPYTASDATPCAEDQCTQLSYRVVGYYTVSPTPTGFKTSLYNDGPSYWRFTVHQDFRDYWHNGGPEDVYLNQSYNYQGGHAVLLIGWDDTRYVAPGNYGAYLCKNSWGASGGPMDNGTFWIAYSGHANSLSFGMSNFNLTALTCTYDSDCDDGLYCNGAETCEAGACQEGTPPDCSDDGLFCNGSEFCDEEADMCGHTGDPCGQGTVCNEETDTCDLPDCGNGVCDQGEDCNSCPGDCPSGSGSGDCSACFKGVCDGNCHPVKEGPDCADCSPGWCCGDGVCEGDEDGYNCAIDCGAPPVCGNFVCDPGEDPCNCPGDCGAPPSTETDCGDGIDNDCDGPTDCDDGDCSGDPACSCLAKGEVCDYDGECCSEKCRGGKCR
jgi:C1A family cysteine protease